jgi:hypothetical protein
LVLACIFAGCSGADETVTVSLGGEEFVLEVADSPEERQRGLMNRRSLGENRGMLFVFPHDEKLSFWMKDTQIPLSIAYIAKDGTIKEIKEMEPYSLRPVESTYSVRYALEVNRGTFDRLGIEPGDKINLPDFRP